MTCNNNLHIWFWQLIVSPHMADLAVKLAGNGCNVTYVAEQEMSTERASQGWTSPSLNGVKLQLVTCKKEVLGLAETAPSTSIHICQGIRANGLITVAHRVLRRRELENWVIMETVEDSGWRGLLKRFVYAQLFKSIDKSFSGVLATGHRTKGWLIDRGVPDYKIFPFAYFLPDKGISAGLGPREVNPFIFIFVGRLIKLKRVDWIIDALSGLLHHKFELWVVGAGSEEAKLRLSAEAKLSKRIRWFGQLKLDEVSAVMVKADCLILPSIHDGWGAVASEALLVGTPVICSDACGVAEVVHCSGDGGVFPATNFRLFQTLLLRQIEKGFVDSQRRERLRAWSKCLNSSAGADYLVEIISSSDRSSIVSPWMRRDHD